MLAARAEGLRLRRLARRQVRRAVYGVIAAAFAIALLVMLHALLYFALADFGHIRPFFAALIVFVVDLVLAAIFGVLAAGAGRDPVEAEAGQLRDRSLAELREQMAALALVRPAARLIGARGAYGATLLTLLLRYLAARRRG